MGYYSLDPLGKGFFRIDPAATLPPEALAFYSENQAFNAGVVQTIKMMIKAATERAAKKVIAEVSEETVEAVGKKTVEKVAQKSSTEASQQIAKEYPELAAKAARNETGAKGRFQNLVNQRSKKLFDEKIVAKETGEKVSKETGETVVEQTAQETGENAVERVTKYGIKTGVLGGFGYALLSGPFSGFTEVIGNLGDNFTGANCREKVESNYPDAAADELDAKVEECEAQAANALVKLAGAAGLGLLGLGALVVVRLIPKRKSPAEPLEDSE